MAVNFLGEADTSRIKNTTLQSREYTHVLRFETTEVSDSANDVVFNENVPRLGTTYSSDSRAHCIKITVVNTDPWQGWTVDCLFSTASTISTTDPEKDEILISFASEIFQVEVLQGRKITGEEVGKLKAITNSAGDRMTNPPPHGDDALLVIQTASNHRAIPQWLLLYQNAVNSKAFTAEGLKIAAGKAKLQRIDVGSRKIRTVGPNTDIIYYPLSLTVHVRAEGWNLRLVDKGWRELQPFVEKSDTVRDPGYEPPPGYEDEQLVNIQAVGDEEEPVDQIFLDGEGHQLIKGTVNDEEFQRLPVMLEWQIYNKLDFRALPGFY